MYANYLQILEATLNKVVQIGCGILYKRYFIYVPLQNKNHLAKQVILQKASFENQSND